MKQPKPEKEDTSPKVDNATMKSSSESLCKNCGHPVINVKNIGWRHLLINRNTPIVDILCGYDEKKQCECKKPEPSKKEGRSTEHSHRVEVQSQKRHRETEISRDRSMVADTLPSDENNEGKLNKVQKRRIYYLENRDIIIQKSLKRYYGNKDSIRKQRKTHYLQNKEKILERNIPKELKWGNNEN